MCVIYICVGVRGALLIVLFSSSSRFAELKQAQKSQARAIILAPCSRCLKEVLFLVNIFCLLLRLVFLFFVFLF